MPPSRPGAPIVAVVPSPLEADVPFVGMNRVVHRGGRPSRVDVAGAEYEDVAAAAGYAAAHDGWGPAARYFHSRLHVVQESLRACSGGDLLDVGCGPGILVRRLLNTRGNSFRITACDRSPGMVAAAAERITGADRARLTVSRIEEMPFPDRSFDVALATGVLEYTQAESSLRELARVVRPGGLVVVTMLNPFSPYCLFEWIVYWPALRLLGCAERLMGLPPERRHGARRSGIRAIPEGRLRRLMCRMGLRPHDVVYYDLTPLVPPVDRIVRRWSRRWRAYPERTVSRGRRRWMGTGYLVAARRDG